jgi:glycosyltransferase involved in cell wall biosynthesis
MNSKHPKKIAFIATKLLTINAFLIDQINTFVHRGWEVHVFGNSQGLKKNDLPPIVSIHHLPFSRNPFSFDNLISFIILNRFRNDFDILYTHTPIASFVSRFIFRKSKTFIVYFAHGFHFYKGSSSLSWLIYFNLERYLSKFTHLLFTINEEDYLLAQRKLNPTNCVLLPFGVGVDMERIKRFLPFNGRFNLRKILKINPDEIIMTSLGEVNQNKNQLFVIKALANYKIKNIHYVIIGNNDNKYYHKVSKFIKKNGLSNIHFLGHQLEPFQYLTESDIFVFPSLREGLPVSIMEAYLLGLPIIASNIRGIRDLSKYIKDYHLINTKNFEDIYKVFDFYYDRKKIRLRNEVNNFDFDKHPFNRKLISIITCDKILQQFGQV